MKEKKVPPILGMDLPPDMIVLEKGRLKLFFDEIGFKSNRLITALGPTVGAGLAALMVVLGVNVASVGGIFGAILGLFGVTMLSVPLLAPFIIGAVLVVATSLGISWKSSVIKKDAATPLNILGHTIACDFFLPAWTFVRERGHTLNKTPEALQKKLRKKMEDMGYTQQYLDFFWRHVEPADGAKLRNAVSRLAEVREALQKKLPGTGKLYKKDFKESTLYKEAKEHCNTMNSHCSHLGHKMENERAIEALLLLLDKKK
ncbi:MAG: hypothetical protein IJW57_05350 [Spirochaetaceae bacterium]|nr:hypothetical protein [Spirochaetaceae bacterium]MBQ8560078.1 hypothetical protein [Spirochaetaceae bacterium]